MKSVQCFISQHCQLPGLHSADGRSIKYGYGMVEGYWQGKTEVLRWKHIPVMPHPQIPHRLPCAPTHASALRNLRLNTWTLACLILGKVHACYEVKLLHWLAYHTHHNLYTAHILESLPSLSCAFIYNSIHTNINNTSDEHKQANMNTGMLTVETDS